MKKLFQAVSFLLALAAISYIIYHQNIKMGATKESENSTDLSILNYVEEPTWIKVCQENGRLYQNLNLDGIGRQDDEIYVCNYRFGEYKDGVTAIFVHLGTGKILAKTFPYGWSEVKTGNLLAMNRESIFLEVTIPESNYGATNIYILDVSAAEKDDINILRDPELTIFLETENAEILESNRVPQSFTERILKSINGDIISGNTIVNMKNKKLQGINVHINKAGELYNVIIYWNEEEYKWESCGDAG